jgi:hypothetical protein
MAVKKKHRSRGGSAALQSVGYIRVEFSRRGYQVASRITIKIGAARCLTKLVKTATKKFL